MSAYYNEIDPYAAQWLRNLINKQLITAGEVDERPIQDVRPADLTQFTRCHFFAGIAGWDIALQQANWPTDKQVWTGSCPCQGFSAAGLGRGFADERHLWPFWFHLIEQCRPPTIFGEQVSSKLALEWFDLVQADLESAEYAVGSADLCAASVGAAHIRQRLWFVADSQRVGYAELQRCGDSRLDTRPHYERPLVGFESGRAIGLVADTRRAPGCAEQQHEPRDGARRRAAEIDDAGARQCGGASLLAHPNGRHPSPEGIQRGGEQRQFEEDRGASLLEHAACEQVGLPRRARESRATAGELGDASRDGQRQSWLTEAGERRQGASRGSGPWSDCDWLPCTDGKARSVEPGSFPLAHGVQRRASKLRAYGNAIVPQVAAEFIKAYLACRP